MQQTLSEAIDDYCRWRAAMSVGKQTIRNEKSILNRFLAVNGNIQCRSLDDRHVTRHFEEATKTRSTASLRLDHTVLSALFEWMRQTRRIPSDRDPLFGRKPAKAIRKERDRIHESAFPRLLTLAGERDPQVRALLAVLLYTLLRDQDVADLRIRDVDLEGGYLRCRIKKTRQEDRLPICAELDTELRAWLTHYTTEVGPLEPHYYLVPRRNVTPVRATSGGRYDSVTTRLAPDLPFSRGGRIIRPVLEAAGFPVTDVNGESTREGSHTVRRSGARALFDRLVADGYDGALRVVQAMLHHSSIEQTERYIGITADRRTRDELLRGKQMYRQPPEGAAVFLVR